VVTAHRLQYATTSISRARYNDAWSITQRSYAEALDALMRATQVLPDLVAIPPPGVGHDPGQLKEEIALLSDGIANGRAALRALLL
jgi:hypothetical protein